MQNASTNSSISEVLLSRLSEFVASHIGLYFPEERRRDLERGIVTAAKEFHHKDAGSCIEWLLSAPVTKRQIEVLASHLTVGETYFFREKKSFQALEGRVFPDLIGLRGKNNERHLRVWSAGCCTGDEPYSIAMLLHKLLPDLSGWNITLLATDINPDFLQKAETGIYGEWSFRETPPWVKEKYFSKTKSGKYEILPHIKKLVTFSYLNLAEDAYPSLLNNTNAMDLILCRNVLMYFKPSGAEKAAGNFYRCLLNGGWLFVSSGELSHANSTPFVTMNFPEVICYKKDTKRGLTLTPENLSLGSDPIYIYREQEEVTSLEFGVSSFELKEKDGLTTRDPEHETRNPIAGIDAVIEKEAERAPVAPYDEALSLYAKGDYKKAEKNLLDFLSQDAGDAKSMALLSRVYANLGKLDEALSWCDKATAADKLIAAFHYLKAIILQEQRKTEEAVASLRRALYLDTHFVLAHFSLGNLSRQTGKLKESQKHYGNTLSLLSRLNKDDVLPESEGLTAGRLMEIVQNMQQAEIV